MTLTVIRIGLNSQLLLVRNCTSSQAPTTGSNEKYYICKSFHDAFVSQI